MEEKEFLQCKERIIKVLKYAYDTRYYNDVLKKAGLESPQKIENISYEEFKKIPCLSKQDLNVYKFDMLTKKFNGVDKDYYDSLPYGQKREYLSQYGLELRVTSGSTGIPVEVLKSKDDIKRDYVVLNYMRRKLTTYDFKGKFVWIWPVNPLTRKYFYPDSNSEKQWSVNKYGTQIMLYEHSDENLKEIYDFIKMNHIEWITSSPTALVSLANYMSKYHKRIDTIKYVECHSEYLYNWQEEIISNMFGCSPVSIYSSNEIQFIGAMCTNKKWHICGNSCFIEFLTNEYGTKDICVTSLNYLDLPVIRYKLGDCGKWCDEDKHCDLRGNSFELSKFRKNDYIILQDGNRMESFAITDSVVFLCNNFGLDIHKYRVEQITENEFTYYFDFSLQKAVNQECQLFLEKYLGSLTKYNIKVNLKFCDIDSLTYYGNKFKYFQVNDRLKRKYQ